MFVTLTVLTVLITLMFVGSIFSSIAALRDEAKHNEEMNRHYRVF